MFIDIWGRFVLGAVAGSLAGLLLVWIVRHIFRCCWLPWGLMEPSDEPPATHDAQARRLDVQLKVEGALCGVVLLGSFESANPSVSGLLWSCSVFCALLLLQARIDAQTGMLPDRLTLFMLWLGLLFSLGGGWVSLEQSVAGAAAGYIVMWLLVTAFRVVMSREAMGRGDFKLSAAMGAWLGPWALPTIWLVASIWVCLTAALDHVSGRQNFRAPRPFGPGLAIGGILVMLSQVN